MHAEKVVKLDERERRHAEGQSVANETMLNKHILGYQMGEKREPHFEHLYW